MNKNLLKTTLPIILAASLFAVKSPVFAADTFDDGDNEKSLKIVKEVKFDGDNTYKDKIFVDLSNKSQRTRDIIFRIKITNTGDKTDKLKMTDFLPSELNKLAGNLTEEWNSLEKGETKEFIIRVRVKDTEIKADKDYEKCVVNKAEIKQDGNFMGSDTATVCYGNEPVELPRTGFWSFPALAGLAMISLGGLLKSAKR